MLKQIQTRLHRGSLPEERGNCYPTVLACLLDKEVDNVFQVQMFYDDYDWSELLDKYLLGEGYRIQYIKEHLMDGSCYMVSGVSPRNPNIDHICIYQNGKLFHDPHPSGDGIITEERFTILEKI